MSVHTKIAKAIKKADKSYFFEDYSKQAAAVLSALDNAGYRIVPKDLDKDIYKKIADNMKTGTMKPEKHIENLYHTFVEYM